MPWELDTKYTQLWKEQPPSEGYQPDNSFSPSNNSNNAPQAHSFGPNFEGLYESLSQRATRFGEKADFLAQSGDYTGAFALYIQAIESSMIGCEYEENEKKCNTIKNRIAGWIEKGEALKSKLSAKPKNLSWNPSTEYKAGWEKTEISVLPPSPKLRPTPPAPSFNSNPTPSAPSFNSNITPSAPSFNSNPTPSAPSFNSNPTPSAPSFNSNITPSAPSFNSNPTPSAPSFDSNPTPSAPSFNSNLTPSAPSFHNSNASAPPIYYPAIRMQPNYPPQSIPYRGGPHCCAPVPIPSLNGHTSSPQTIYRTQNPNVYPPARTHFVNNPAHAMTVSPSRTQGHQPATPYQTSPYHSSTQIPLRAAFGSPSSGELSSPLAKSPTQSAVVLSPYHTASLSQGPTSPTENQPMYPALDPKWLSNTLPQTVVDSSSRGHFMQQYKPSNEKLSHLESEWIIMNEGPNRSSKFSFSGEKVSSSHPDWRTVELMLVGLRRCLLSLSDNMSMGTRMSQTDFSSHPQHTLASNYGSYTFTDFAPHVFLRLRQQFGIKHTSFCDSLFASDALLQLKSPGKSKSFLYFTTDNKYILKTASSSEAHFLKSLISSYYHFMADQPESLLCRLCGFYEMVVPGESNSVDTLSFFIMENVLSPTLDFEMVYDLKGSTKNRSTSPEDANKPSTVYKDLDLPRGAITLTAQHKGQLLAQLLQDASWLEYHGVMDHSLLVGIHKVDKSRYKYYYDPHAPFHRRYSGGLQSHDGKYLYFLGVIDILTLYDTKKFLESSWKSLWTNQSEISAVNPQLYKDRFLYFIDSYCISSH